MRGRDKQKNADNLAESNRVPNFESGIRTETIGQFEKHHTDENKTRLYNDIEGSCQ